MNVQKSLKSLKNVSKIKKNQYKNESIDKKEIKKSQKQLQMKTKIKQKLRVVKAYIYRSYGMLSCVKKWKKK